MPPGGIHGAVWELGGVGLGFGVVVEGNGVLGIVSLRLVGGDGGGDENCQKRKERARIVGV